MYDSVKVKRAEVVLSAYDTIRDSCRTYLLHERGILVESLTKAITDASAASSSSSASPAAAVASSHEEKSRSSSRNRKVQSRAASEESKTASAIVDEEDGPEPLPIQTVHQKIAAILATLWRRECRRSLLELLNMTSKKFKVVARTYEITARSLEDWAAHINEGAMPANSRGTLDPWGLWNRTSSIGPVQNPPSRFENADRSDFLRLIQEELVDMVTLPRDDVRSL